MKRKDRICQYYKCGKIFTHNGKFCCLECRKNSTKLVNKIRKGNIKYKEKMDNEIR